MLSPLPDRYLVVGNPIAHSLSPKIHRLFAAQTGQTLTYQARLLPLEDFAAHAGRLLDRRLRGLNVTVPFKPAAYQWVDALSPRARLAGAVNTVSVRADGLHGDNTDGVGMVRDLTVNLGMTLATRRILVLGAGGAVRGVLGPLLDTAPGAVTIANRTPEKAAQLARRFSHQGEVDGVGYDRLAGRRFDLIINGSAAGLHGQVAPLPAGIVRRGGMVYDMLYAATETPFLRWTRAQGVDRLADGLGMLVEQAAEAFWIWRGVRPDSRAVMRALRPAVSAAD